MGVFSGVARCRYVTPALCFFALGYISCIPLLQQYFYTLVLSMKAEAANITLDKGDRVIPCSNDTSSPQYAVQVAAQETTALILALNALSLSLPTLATVLYWGPLSDIYGRKPILVVSFVGGFIYLVVNFITIHFELPFYTIFVGSFVCGLSGNVMSAFSASAAYVTDVSTPETRSMRIFIMDAGFLVSIGFTIFAVCQWTAAVGRFDQPFLGSFGCMILGLLYTLFILPESIRKDTEKETIANDRSVNGTDQDRNPVNLASPPKPKAVAELSNRRRSASTLSGTLSSIPAALTRSINRERSASTLSKTRSASVLCDPSVISDASEEEVVDDSRTAVVVVTGCPMMLKKAIDAFKHEGDNRWNVLLILPTAAFFFSFCANVGGFMMQQLFLENLPFCWDTSKIGNISTVKLVGTQIVSVITLILLKRLKINDYLVSMLSCSLSMISHLVFAFSDKDWNIFVGMAVSSISLTIPCIRSGLSKECARDRVGSMFAGVAFFETLANLFGNLAISPLYSATVSFFPGFSFFFMTIMEFCAFCFLITSYLILRRKAKDSPNRYEQFR